MVRATTNPHFQLYEHEETHNLVDDLIAESIELHGWDMYYMPRRRSDNFDDIYYEDEQSYFDTAHQIPMYIKSSQGFMGAEALMSNFGIEVQLQLILTVGYVHFDELVGQAEYENEIYRPREGDLIHIPKLDYRTYEIKFVDEHPYFYQHGKQNMYDLTVEVFRYAGEDFSTGIPEVDCMADKTTINAYDWSVLSEEGLSLLSEDDDIITVEEFRTDQPTLIEGNDEFIVEAGEPTDETIINWDEDNPWGENGW